MRLRKGWSQAVLAARVGLSREAISRAERGEMRGMTLARLEQIAMALGASLAVQVRWQGEQLDRLIDAGHAALQEAVARLLTSLGWIVRVETSFNHYGDRGRVDVLAFDPRSSILLAVEIKSALGDLQETLGRLDTKVRVAPIIAREPGWTDVAAVVGALVIGDSRGARQVVGNHPLMFDRFALRGRAAVAWLRRPRLPVPTGLLWFVERRDSRAMCIRRVRRSTKPTDSHRA
jgi:transcriptional regulator with XRE-family HTH domain